MAINTNKNSTAEAIKTIKSIHHIDGFDTDTLTTPIAVTNGNGAMENKEFLPLPYKKAWARMVFPHYKLRVITHEFVPDRENSDDKGRCGGYAHSVVRFYEDKNDPEDAYIGEGESYYYVEPFNSTASYINDALQLAKGSAISKALTEAGFGLQYYVDNLDELLLKAEAAEAEKKNKKRQAKITEDTAAAAPPKESVAKPLLIKDDVSATSVPEDNNGVAKPVKSKAADTMTIDTARNTKVDCGRQFLKDGKELKDLSPEEMVWVYGNTKDCNVRKACLFIARQDDDIRRTFSDHGIPA